MNMGRVVYWHKNQVVIRFRAHSMTPTNLAQPVNPIQIIVGLIKDALKGLNVELQVFDTIPSLSPHASSNAFADSADFLLFTHINPGTQHDMGTMEGSNGTMSTGNDDHSLEIIEQLNSSEAFRTALQVVGVSVDALPHWLWTGTEDQTHGCPVCPYGRLVGFPMADHGLAIAGIIRDLAPNADIECIRVLNDYGVGDLRALIKALASIQERMHGGNLDSRPVVINLSLVVLPPDNAMPNGLTEDILKSMRDLLYSHLQNLADCGAVLVASTGNDSDPRDIMMNPSEIHFGPRYPAALAYDTPPVTTMIPVGAVNRNGHAATYSNHPGHFGIATYAGELPKPDPWLPSAMSHTVTRVDATGPIDALCCLYTARVYPALSMNDHHTILPASPSEYPMYEASSTWAYWSGTSFSTPIISALAARILQGGDPRSIDVRQAIIDAAIGETVWTRVGDDKEDISGHVIMAVQEWQSADEAVRL